MAYTKYSLTPANNTATPPDGAPEGMLPSAVNDTMRDMMAQIRDVGDGIRDGTYTMTAAKITGGTITGVAFTGNTFTSPVISGGSINNTPIGATTANTGAFTTLSATGVTTVQAGTNSAPAITTSGDTNTGIFFPAADTIAFTEGGVESMRIDSSGNVGIGVTPSAWSSSSNALQNNGGALWQFGGSNFYVGQNYYFNGTNRIYTTTAEATEYQQGAGTHRWFTAPSGTAGTAATFTERMRITSGGNVGINTTTFSTGYLTIDTKAQVGIDIYRSDSTAQYNGIRFRNTTNTTTYGSLGWDSGGLRLDGDAGTMYFSTSGTERMRITSGGEVCIGGVTSSAFKLRVATTAAATFGDDYDGTNYGVVQIVRPANQPDNKFHLSFVRAGNKVAGIGFLDNSDTFAIHNPSTSDNSGSGVTLTNNATSWGTTSDERKKDIISPVENALTKLADWRSVYYKYKTDEETDPQRVGLIAQDILATLPEAVSVEKDELQTLQLRYTEVIPVLVKAIQELNAKVEAQAAEIALLKSK